MWFLGKKQFSLSAVQYSLFVPGSGLSVGNRGIGQL